MQLDELAPGVMGYTVDKADALYVPMIIATKPGNGDVGRYLDTLPTDRKVIVPNVMNPILMGMLDRRGFVPSEVYDFEVFHCMIPLMIRETR